MFRIAYLGYSEKMLELLFEHKDFDVALVIATKGRISKEYYKLIEKYHANYIEVSSKKELLERLNMLDGVDAAIMYKFEFIIPAVDLNKHRYINFHGGNLRNNRGAHAVVWSILLQESETCLSCYQLSGGIDEGYLIDEYPVAIEKSDNPCILNEKLAGGIPTMLDNVVLFLLGKRNAVLIEGGTYRRKIVEEDYTIKLRDDSIDSMRTKILSQQAYDGAVVILDGRKHRIKRFEISDKRAYCENRLIEQNNDTIRVQDGEFCITMYFL